MEKNVERLGFYKLLSTSVSVLVLILLPLPLSPPPRPFSSFVLFCAPLRSFQVNAREFLYVSKPNSDHALVQYDTCTSFDQTCRAMLMIQGCPAAQFNVTSCSGPSPDTFVGVCSCAASVGPYGEPTDLANTASTRAKEYLIDAMLTKDVVAIRYNPPPRSPASLLIGSNNFKQFLAPLYPLPGFTQSSM